MRKTGFLWPGYNSQILGLPSDVYCYFTHIIRSSPGQVPNKSILIQHIFANPFPQDMVRIARVQVWIWIKSYLIPLNLPNNYSRARTELGPCAWHGFCFKLCGRIYIRCIWAQYYKKSVPVVSSSSLGLGWKNGIQHVSSVFLANLHHVHQFQLATKNKTLL